MIQPRVLLVSGGSGAGHAVAAQALEHEFAARGLPVTHLDAYAFLSPLTRFLYTRMHGRLLEFAPKLYGPLFERGSQSRLLQRAHERVTARSRETFRRALADLQPAVLCVTHALGCALAAPLRAGTGFRLVVLTTDYRTHAFHLHPEVDAYCASHAWAAADLRAAGVPAERITVTGIPLRPSFDSPPDPSTARQALALPPGHPVILVTRGGMAAGRETVRLLRALLAAPALRSAVLVAVLGSESRSYRLVSASLSPTPRLRLERFVPNMETYLAAADIVIGKAGGLSSTETFAVGRPLVIYAPYEGVEAANVRRFVAAGAAVDTGRSPERVVGVVSALLQDPARRQALVASARALLTEESRQAVVRVVQELLGNAPGWPWGPARKPAQVRAGG